MSTISPEYVQIKQDRIQSMDADRRYAGWSGRELLRRWLRKKLIWPIDIVLLAERPRSSLSVESENQEELFYSSPDWDGDRRLFERTVVVLRIGVKEIRITYTAVCSDANAFQQVYNTPRFSRKILQRHATWFLNRRANKCTYTRERECPKPKILSWFVPLSYSNTNRMHLNSKHANEPLSCTRSE